jgi:hypothetical protein
MRYEADDTAGSFLARLHLAVSDLSEQTVPREGDEASDPLRRPEGDAASPPPTVEGPDGPGAREAAGSSSM